jgi:very-short-patch-repair endonuclease
MSSLSSMDHVMLRISMLEVSRDEMKTQILDLKSEIQTLTLKVKSLEKQKLAPRLSQIKVKNPTVESVTAAPVAIRKVRTASKQSRVSVPPEVERPLSQVQVKTNSILSAHRAGSSSLNSIFRDLSLQSPSKGEVAVSKTLEKLDLKYEKEYILRSLPSNRYDFYVQRYNLVIEFDGRQHFVWDSNGDFVKTQKELQSVQEIDILKTKEALKAGFTVLRIHYSYLEQPEKLSKSIRSACKEKNKGRLITTAKAYTWLREKVPDPTKELGTDQLLHPTCVVTR